MPPSPKLPSMISIWKDSLERARRDPEHWVSFGFTSFIVGFYGLMIAVPFGASMFLFWFTATGIIDTIQHQKLCASLIGEGRNATARVENARMEPQKDGKILSQAFDYTYTDADGRKHRGEFAHRVSDDLERHAFSIGDYQEAKSIAVGFEFPVTYLASAPGTHLPVKVTPEWKRSQLRKSVAAHAVTFVFAFLLTWFYLHWLIRDRIAIAPEPDRVRITIVKATNVYLIVFGLFWIGFAAAGTYARGADALMIVLSIPAAIGAFFIWHGLGAREEITVDGNRLIQRIGRPYRRVTHEYELALIENMRARLVEDKSSRLRFAFDYRGETRRIGVRPLASDEARQIAAALSRYFEVDVNALGEPGPWMADHYTELMETIKCGETPELPEKVAQEVFKGQKPEPRRVYGTCTVWGRSRAENKVFIMRELFGLLPLALLIAVPVAYLVIKGGMPAPVFTVAAPGIVVCMTALAIHWLRYKGRLNRNEPLVQEGSFRDDVKELKDLPGLIIVFGVLGGIFWMFINICPSRSLGVLDAPRRCIYSVLPARQTLRDETGNTIELIRFMGTRIQKFDPSGRLMWAISSYESRRVKERIALDGAGNVYLIYDDVEKYDPDGRFVQEYRGAGANDWFVAPDGKVTNLAAGAR
ncbi:MAG: hypothetical protein ABFD69_06135 [Candidatus Sumerlaeia bacterium]